MAGPDVGVRGYGDRVDSISSGSEWQTILGRPRRPATAVAREDISVKPGIYAWFRDMECVYLGKASNLRSRLATHLSTSPDLSRTWIVSRRLDFVG